MIQSQTSVQKYVGNGVTTSFPFPYRFFVNSDLRVIITRNNIDTPQVLGTNYTVSGADNPSGGTVIFGTAPVGSSLVTISRELQETQNVDYIVDDNFPAETHERALDRLTMLVQQISSKIRRTFRLSVSGDEIPEFSLADRISKIPGFDEQGRLFMYQPNVTVLPTTVDGAVSIKTFGAVGDGVTDDGPALNAALAFCIAAGARLYIPKGRFKISSDIGVKYGCVQIFGDGPESLIDGSGRLAGSHSEDIGWSLGVQSQYDTPNERTATAQNVYAGTDELTLNSTAGLNIGDDILLLLGTAPSDGSLPYINHFCKVATVVSNTITFTPAAPEDIRGTSHKLWKTLKSGSGTSINNIGLNMFSIAIAFVEGFVLEDIYVKRALTCFSAANFHNGVIQRIRIDELAVAHYVGLNSTYGWFYTGWAQYGLTIRDIYIRKTAHNPLIGIEGEPREVRVENIEVTTVDDPDDPGSGDQSFIQNTGVDTSLGDSYRPLTIKNLTIHSQNTLRRQNIAGSIIIENFELTGNEVAGTAFDGTAPFNLFFSPSSIRGWLYFRNKTYRRTRSFHYVFTWDAFTGNKSFSFPMKGIPTRINAMISTLTNISQVTIGEAALSLFTSPNEYFDVSANVVAYDVRNTDQFTVSVGTSSSSTGYLVLEGEMLIPDTPTDDLTPTPDTDAVFRVGAGAPSDSAKFLFQEYFDSTGGKFYKAKAVGTGASDWAILN